MNKVLTCCILAYLKIYSVPEHGYMSFFCALRG